MSNRGQGERGAEGETTAAGDGQFNERKVISMGIGEAIEAMRKGRLVAREGWNGKGMHLYLEESAQVIFGSGAGRGKPGRHYEPVIIMFTAQKTHQPGWLASQADLLARDWMIVEP